MKRWKYWDNDKCPCCLAISEKTVQHLFKCKNLEMKAHKNELYKPIYTWLKEQDTQQILLDMTMATFFRGSFKLLQEYKNYWGSTKQIYKNQYNWKLCKAFYLQECGRNNMDIICIWGKIIKV